MEGMPFTRRVVAVGGVVEYVRNGDVAPVSVEALFCTLSLTPANGDLFANGR